MFFNSQPLLHVLRNFERCINIKTENAPWLLCKATGLGRAYSRFHILFSFNLPANINDCVLQSYFNWPML